MNRFFSTISIFLLTAFIALSPAIALASLPASIFHTSDTDFNGTPSQTAVSGGSVVLASYQPPQCGTATVSYGGQTYTTVLIGTQCWFKENLNAGTMLVNGSTMPSDPAPVMNDPSSVQKWCYGNNATNNGAGGCSTGSAAGGGGLYTWAEMTGLISSCNTTDCSGSINSPHQGICPTGWHIPTDTDHTTLTTYLSSNAQYQCGGNSTYIAKSLASVYTDWNTTSRSTCTVNQLPPPNNNVSGFTELPAGRRYTDGSFVGRGAGTYLWSATQDSDTYAWLWNLLSSYATVNWFANNKTYGYSVRCLKNSYLFDNLYYSSGTYTSLPIQRAQVASWGNLSWTRILNSQPEITMKARTCAASDPTCASATPWTSCDTTTTIANGASLKSGNPNCVSDSQPYIQYQATLYSTDGSQTSYLNDITLDYLYNPDVSIMSGIVKFFGSITFK